MAKKQEAKKAEVAKVAAPANEFKYPCPLCGNTAIETSNKMIGVNINCANCGQLVRLEDESKYVDLSGSGSKSPQNPPKGSGKPPVVEDEEELDEDEE